MARTFDGTDDRINFGNATGLVPQLGMTLAAWVNFDTVSSGEDHIVTMGRGGVSGFNFNRGSGTDNDELQFTKHAVVNINSTAINVPATTWILVAAVVSSTQVRFHKYVPGTGLTSENVANNQALSGTPTEANIGCVLDSGGTPVEFMAGGICEVAKWNRELSDAEITSLGLGFSASFMPRSLTFYSQLIGNNSPETNILGGTTGALTGTAKLAHPRIIYPKNYQIAPFAAAAAASTYFGYYGPSGYF